MENLSKSALEVFARFGVVSEKALLENQLLFGEEAVQTSKQVLM